jgi:GT2 family glycosyltransferase
MNNKEKIGLGIITCNRSNYINVLLDSLKTSKSSFDHLVIVNDGKPVELKTHFDCQEFIENETNLGVAKTKNKALRRLNELDCKYIFLIEDDVIINDGSVFEKYILASNTSGIKHLNYGPGTPFNRKQTTNFDIHNRHELSSETEPNPKLIIDYKQIKIALYEHVAGMFSFFDRDVLTSVGFLDERFYNAWEHVDHTYRIIKANFHPPFWWFADIENSHNYISEHKDAIQNSSIAKDSDWMANVKRGADLYNQIHGHFPNQPPRFTQQQVIETLKQIKNG